MTGTDRRVVVVGGGVIGLSCAWRLAGAGLAVTVVDPAPGSGASWVAGGMLAPVTEAWPGEERLLALGEASLARWPEFAARLSAAAGVDAGLRTEGTVVAAVDGADREELDGVAAHLARLGREVRVLSGRELRRLEPTLGPAVRGGLSVPGDLAVDNRALLGALRAALGDHGRAACGDSGADSGPGSGDRGGGRGDRGDSGGRGEAHGASGRGTGRVRFVARRAVAVRGGEVELDDGGVEHGDEVLLAAGPWSADLHPALRGRLRPVKGEIVRLRARSTALPPPERTVRAVVSGRPVYLVPRAGGRLVLGATQYEAGFDTEVTVAGVRDLLRDAETVLPGVAEYAIEEVSAGLRPASNDNLPLVGRLGPGLLVATGHGRNGILLAPVTADAVCALVCGDPVPSELTIMEEHDEGVAQRR
ncbi:MAG TPA: FAD-dependent oxidoreductase [Pseudonocardiaceae bacterium]